MKCATCHSQSSRIIVTPDGEESCHNCGGFSEAGGTKLDGILTRQRVRHDAAMGEVNIITPHKYNKQKRDFDINPDFVKHYPQQASEMYTPQEMIKAGMPKLVKPKSKPKADQSVRASGSAKQAIKRIINGI